MSKKKQVVGVFLVLAMVVLVACAPKAAPAPAQAPAPQAPAAAPAPARPAVAPARAAPSKPAWEVEWDEAVAGAKREGRIVLYTLLGGQRRQIVVKSFTDKYGINIESVSGMASLMFSKIFTEQRAGIYSGDIWVGSSTSFVGLKGALDSLDPVLILPELREPDAIKKTWYFGETPWADKAHTMLIGLMEFKQLVAFNTSLVQPGEIKAYRDLLAPKWKGNISLNDPRVASNGNWWFAAVLEMGDVDANFIRELASQQDLFVTRDWRLQMDWLTRGKQAIAIAPDPAMFTEFAQLGAPVKRISVGTPAVAGSISGVAMFKRAPNSNATKLFINWLMSQEGGTFLSRAVGAQSRRLDVPTTHLDPSMVLAPGLKVYNADNEDFATKKDTVYVQLAKEILGP